MIRNNINIANTKAQDALDMISGHLIDPRWHLMHKNLTKEQQNTLIVNRIYKDFPRGFKTLPWILKSFIKEVARKW